MSKMREDGAYVREVEAEIRALISQMRSNPSPSLLLTLRSMLGIEGINKGLIEEAERAIQEATAGLPKASMATLPVIGDLGLDAKQMKLVAEFYTSLDDFKKDVKKYKEALAELELEIKKKEAEFEKLTAIIKADPMSVAAREAHASRNEAVMEMIKLSAAVHSHDNSCEMRLEQCNAKRLEIEKDGSLTDRQREVLKGVARAEIEAVEDELTAVRGKVRKYDEQIVAHFEKALLDQIALETCSTRDEYTQTLKGGLLPEERMEISGFVQKMKGTPQEHIHARYGDFIKGLVKQRLGVTAVKEGAAPQAARQGDALAKSDNEAAGGIFDTLIRVKKDRNTTDSKTTQDTQQETHVSKLTNKQSTQKDGFAASVIRSKEPNSEFQGRS